MSDVYRSRDCLQKEIGLLRDRVKRLEAAGDLLAEWHLAVVTTREKAWRDVARWNEAKGEKPQPCKYCMEVECKCGDFDVDPDMGAK